MISNQIRSVLLLGTLSGLLFLMGYAIGGSAGVVVAFFVSLAMNFYSYYYSDKFVLSSYKAQPLPKEQFPEIYEMVQELAKEYKMPMPKLWYVPTDVANAFATGRNPENGHVAVTQGILGILSPRELRGVLAHELGHIKNRDILVSSIAVTIASAIGMLANSLKWASYAEPDNQGGNAKALLIAMVMPVAASLLHFGLSRSRESLADESGAHACRDPLALASALTKLEQSVRQERLVPESPTQATTASLFIVYPFTNETLSSLFSSHPPTAKRVAKLKEMAREMGQF